LAKAVSSKCLYIRLFATKAEKRNKAEDRTHSKDRQIYDVKICEQVLPTDE